MDCKQEVEELHSFFVGWFHGQLGNDDAAWARFEGALAPEFALVSPDGSLTDREALARRLRELHGSRAGGAFRIWIEGFTEHRRDGALSVVTYVECQELDDQETRRRATAIFVADPDAPCGCRWLHVHETWLAGHAPQA